MTLKNRFLPIANAITFVAMIVVNVVFQFGSNSTANVSNLNITLLTPSGFTFSIWILIYGLLLIYTVKQVINPQDNGIDELYFISSILNIIWIITWSYELIFASLLVIIAMALVLLAILNKLKYDRSITKITFSIYYAWISIASIISIFAFITNINNGVYDTSVLRIASVLTIAVFTILAYINRNNIPYILVIIWALLGIVLKQIDFFKGRYMEIIIASILVMLASTIIAFSRFIKIEMEDVL